ncbi:MAG: transport permease protein [Betaproteobacteria bacterium]|nr:MAG: transport permease protein [Betaproteobacteria bacterium]
MQYLRELAENAHLVLNFARRDIRAKYKQTILGVAWAVIQPLTLMVVFTFVFSLFARVPSDGLPYPIFSYSVLIFWMFFSACISQGTIAMTANAGLVRKIWFPRETLLLAVILSALVDLVIASVILAGMFVFYQIPLTWTALWVLPLLALQIVFALGVILVTSAVHVHYRDVGHALPLIMQVWMYATPIAYSLTSVPEWLKPLFVLNPMTGIIDGYRRVLLRATPPDHAALVIAAVASIALLLVSYTAFKRAERTFADVI